MRLVVTAILLVSAGYICSTLLPDNPSGFISILSENLPAWTRRLNWTTMQSLFPRAFTSPNQRHVQPLANPCVRQFSPYDSTVRTVMTDDTIAIYAWPSRGGVIVLEQASAIDFDFLGLDRLKPPLRRASNQAAEDSLCKQLLLLGAKWWDSERRYDFVIQVNMMDERAITALNLGKALPPTLRERRWVKVGWPGEPQGGLWVAEFDTTMYEIKEEENLVPGDAARVMLARNMDERCEILRKTGARFFRSVDEYKGQAFLKAWEDKLTGEVGPLVQTWYKE